MERQVDLCIVGAAGAGMSAAVSAAQHGVKRILVLEKMKNPGGCTVMSAGMMGIDTPAQRRFGKHLDVDEAYRKLMRILNWRCDAKLVRKWLLGSGDNFRWLEELGLESPKTYDDLHNVLTQFKEQKNASAPLVIPVNTGVQGNLLYGYNIDNYYQVDGQVRFGPMQPEFKEYLTMMNQWYNEGLLSDSFLTSQAEVLMDFSTILSGDTGVWCGSGTQSITQLLSMAAESQPDMRITGMTNVTKDGDTAHVGTESQILDSIMWSITTECSDPAAIARYVDYLYSDAGILLANYGVEGETFHYVDGKPVLTELVTNNPDYSYNLALNIFTCDRQTPVPFIIDEQKARNDYSEDQSNAVAVWNGATDGLYNIPRQGVNMTTKEQEKYNSIYSDIDTYMDETISKFVVGDLSLDQFDSFVQKLKDMGIEDCIAIEQTAYNRYLEA